MSSVCKIVMYHYVRPIKGSKFPEIKGLEKDSFIRQIEYFKNNFDFITVKQLLNSIYNNDPIPENSIILTFDDGFKDHYFHVFPILKKWNIQGLFFPPGQVIEEHKVSDVHKIHFILANCKNLQDLVNEIFYILEPHTNKFNREYFKTYASTLPDTDRYDSKEIVIVKRWLQRDLPPELRKKCIDELFKKYVTEDEKTFSMNLYLSFGEIREMIDSGMYFGSHGYSHDFLSYLSEQELDLELKNSMSFYHKINHNNNELIMCYPYGDYNETIIKKLKNLNFKAGLTVDLGDAILTRENSFKLKRYDANDFPK